MQPSVTPSATVSSSVPGYAVVLSTIAAICAILALPFGFIPFLGMAGSTLILGFLIALAIWTHRKRAIIGSAIALLAVIISFISSFIFVSAILESKREATARVAQVEARLQALQAQTTSASGKNVIGDLIKMLDTNNDLTREQANTLGQIAEWGIHALSSNDQNDSSQQKQ
jgi:glucan phosphoethanolaminetransferase (alkaline phosphatase superfamily)